MGSHLGCEQGSNKIRSLGQKDHYGNSARELWKMERAEAEKNRSGGILRVQVRSDEGLNKGNIMDKRMKKR